MEVNILQILLSNIDLIDQENEDLQSIMDEYSFGLVIGPACTPLDSPNCH